MTATPSRGSPPAAWWVAFCAFCSCAGLGLSALHQLNARAYAIVMAAGVAMLTLIWRRRQNELRRNTGLAFNSAGRGLVNWCKQKRRFKRIFPLSFAIL